MAILYAGSKKDVADSIGVAERTFSSWLSEGCPGDPREYNLREVILWARENKWSGDSDESLIDSIGDEELKSQLVKERIAKLQRENRLADFKIDERSASLVDVVIIETFLRDFAVGVCSAIETVEKKHGPDSCDPIRKLLERITKQIDGGALDISGEQ